MSVTATYGSLNITASPYGLLFGADFGAPQNVTEALALLLQDGEVELTDRTSNRTITFQIFIEGANLLALATAEAAFMAEANKPMNTLTIDPGDSGPATVYETYRAQVVWNRDDSHDMQRIRLYTVTIKAMPAGRSAAQVTAAALPASGATTTLVNAGSATTGWTGAVSAGSLSGPTVVSGAVKVGTTAALTGTVNVSATLTTAITTSSTKFLVIDWKPESTAGAPDFRAYGDGTILPLMAQYASPTAGYTRSWVYVAAASIAVLLLESRSTIDADKPAFIRSIYVDNINRTDVQPSFGSSRQSIRTVDVAGSARTQGSLTVEHASSALGDVIVYTFPDGDGFNAYTPPLRQYRVAGGAVVSADAARVSGSSDNIKGGVSTFDIPVANLIPGMHTLVTRMSSSPPETLTWTVATRVNGTQIGSTATGAVTMPDTSGTYANRAITQISLPTVDLAEPVTNAVIRVTLTTTGTGTGSLDEAWLFNTTIGRLVMVSCGTGAAASGGPARRLFIEPGTVTQPGPTLRIGHASDWSDAFYPVGAVSSWQFPQFVPPRARAFVVTSNATEPSVTLRHYPRWDLNAAS